ncbi:MAG TPA: hypothetical protein VH475_24035 [Tepidisphaeraceae bacterium]
MNDGDCAQSWEIDLLGPAIVVTPDGAKIILNARLQWLLTAEHTIRFLLSFDGIPSPVVRIIGPADPQVLTSATVAALSAVTDELKPLSASAEAV